MTTVVASLMLAKAQGRLESMPVRARKTHIRLVLSLVPWCLVRGVGSSLRQEVGQNIDEPAAPCARFIKEVSCRRYDTILYCTTSDETPTLPLVVIRRCEAPLRRPAEGRPLRDIGSDDEPTLLDQRGWCQQSRATVVTGLLQALAVEVLDNAANLVAVFFSADAIPLRKRPYDDPKDPEPRLPHASALSGSQPRSLSDALGESAASFGNDSSGGSQPLAETDRFVAHGLSAGRRPLSGNGSLGDNGGRLGHGSGYRIRRCVRD